MVYGVMERCIMGYGLMELFLMGFILVAHY